MTSTLQRLAALKRSPVEEAKAKLLTDHERQQITRELERLLEPMIERMLEAKATELVERYTRIMRDVLDRAEDDMPPREAILVNRREAATMLATSVSTIKRLEGDGAIEAVRVGGRSVAYFAVEIERYALEQRRGGREH